MPKLSDLEITSDTVHALHDLGYTDTGNLIDDDNAILAARLTKEQYLDLAVALTKLRASTVWHAVHWEGRKVQAIAKS